MTNRWQVSLRGALGFTAILCVWLAVFPPILRALVETNFFEGFWVAFEHLWCVVGVAPVYPEWLAKGPEAATGAAAAGLFAGIAASAILHIAAAVSLIIFTWAAWEKMWVKKEAP